MTQRSQRRVDAVVFVLVLALGALVIGDFAAAADRPLPPELRRVLNGHQRDTSGLALLVQEIGGEVALEFEAKAARNPASTMKLLTTLAALETLGPAYTWRTEAHLEGRLRDGRLEGNLVLRGKGDPYLTTERFWVFLRELRARGIGRIDGDLVIDNSYFAPEPVDPAAFDGKPLRSYNVAPDALLVNFKSTRFIFEPDAGGVRITSDPPLANLEIRNGLRLIDRPCRGYQRGVRIRAAKHEAGGVAHFDGNFPARCQRYSLRRAVLDPWTFTYGVFRTLWEELGGELTGGVRLGLAPEVERPFHVFASPTLGEIARWINKYSNNVMTRQLLLTLGAEQFGPPGTEANGIAAIHAWLGQRELGLPGLVLENGSGLSREARISARGLADLLLAGYASPYMPEFIASLPLSGMDGTLDARMRSQKLKGRLHLKTGRLDHVSAMAGYAFLPSGRRYVLVMLHNARDVHRGTGEQLQEALARWLWRYDGSRTSRSGAPAP